MTGSRDRFGADSELDQLAQDLDLDMDAPIGQTFAAALRDKGNDLPPLEDDFSLGDDDFMTAPSQAAEPRHEPALDVFEDEDLLLPPPSNEAAFAEADEFPNEPPPAPPTPSHSAWLQPKPQPDAVEDLPLPPQLAAEAGYDSDSENEEDAPAGQGLGFDYAFSPSPSGGDRAIPRITVHAFCTRTASLSLMRTIMKDRRMKNVSMEVLEGGVPSAIQYYVNETTPNLLIIEGAGDPRQLLGELDQLAQYCDENIRVVVLGQTNDIRLYRELMRRGVSEYLVAPIDPVQMIRSIATLFTDPDAPFTGKTVAVTGVKGGVGASSVAHNLAWALSERVKVNATLIDLDLNFGTTGLDFNQDAAATIADALMSPDRFDDAVMGRLITKATDRLSLFTAPATLDRTYNLEPETYVRVLEQVRGSVPFVILDLPHIWSDWFKSTVIAADELIIV